MVRIPSTHSDEIDLVYRLSPGGWSELFVIARDKIHVIDITHTFTPTMSNPVEDLIKLCNSLIDRQDCCIWFFGESGGTLIRVAVDQQQKHLVDFSITILDVSIDTPLEDLEKSLSGSNLELSVKIKSSHLATILMYQLGKIEALFREHSYAKSRDPFPDQAFSNLIDKWQTSEFSPENWTLMGN